VAIGASTGGTQALQDVLSKLPVDAPPILVVQHMPEKFTGPFARRLNTICQMEVKEAENGDSVHTGRVLIAPGGRHMRIEGNGTGFQVVVEEGPRVNRHRPSVDVLFHSMATCVGNRAMGIILTGMGDDGAVGIKAMHDAGAYTVGQNKATCVVYGMPAEAMRLGGISHEAGLGSMAGWVMKNCEKLRR